MGLSNFFDPALMAYYRNKYLDVDAYQSGYDSGLSTGKSQGRKEEYDAFWDSYQKNGAPTDYSYGFAGMGWNITNFKPKYNLTVTNGDHMFAYSGLGHQNLKKILEDAGVVLDTSACTNFRNMFQYNSPTIIPTIDTRSANNLHYLSNNSGIVQIEIILRDDGSQEVTNMLYYSSGLTDLTLKGTIGKNGFDVHWSTRLTHESMLSIINALADYSADTSGTVWKVTLGDTNLAKLSEEEIGIAEGKGWVLA